MRAIELNDSVVRVIRFDRIKPFKNICKVTGVEEMCNVVTEYEVGGVKRLLILLSTDNSLNVPLTN